MATGKRKLVAYNDIDDAPVTKVQKRHDSGPKRPAEKQVREEASGASASGASRSTVNKKVEKLLGSMDSFFQNIAEADLLDHLGEEGMGHCKALRSILSKKSKPVKASINDDDLAAKLEAIPTAEGITPWTASSIPKNLPRLPEIYDPAREKQAFTHAAIDGTTNYEHLEWVGDIYIELLASLFISSTFPDLKVGRCSQLRERLVKNETLSKFSHEYEFETRARLPPEFGTIFTPKEREKVMGDMFEAYCAAIVYSDPKTGIYRLAVWLKSLWARTLSPEILALKPKSANADGPQPLFPKDLLRQKVVTRGIKLNYRDAAPEKKDANISGHPVFTVGVYIEGWGEEKLLGLGTGLSKKEAGKVAAENALANKKLMSKYEELRRMAEEKIKGATTPSSSGAGVAE